MPFTPFHFGPGLALKGIIGRHMSFSAFVVANVAIDIEPLYYMLRNDPPLHRELHTAIGAMLLAVGLMLLWLLLRAGISRWGGRYRQRWLRGLSSSTPWAVWLGLLLGCERTQAGMGQGMPPNLHMTGGGQRLDLLTTH